MPTTARVPALGETPDRRPYDAGFTPQPALLDALRALPAARRVWYCVLEGERGEANVPAARGITLMANSGALRERLARLSGRPVLDGIGGIDLEVFRPDPSARTAGKLTVLA